jgi:GT2 family glycosyltransferase
MAVLEADATCAVAAPQILNPDGTPQGNARGDPDMLTGLFGRTSPLRRTLSGLDVARRNVITATTRHQDDQGAAVTVDWVSGACMLVRRSAVAAIGGFDERYFMYWEDADLCRRLRQHGSIVCYVPAATAVHRVGQSSRTARAASIRAFHDSAYLYYSTHVAPGGLNPKRWIARALLTARCWWKLRTSS